MTVRQTSLQTFREIKDEGLLGRLQFTVYEELYQCGPCTGGELMERARAMHPEWKTSMLHNFEKRLSELKALGVVAEVGRRSCNVSRRECLVWDVTDRLPAKPERRAPSAGKMRCVNDHADAQRIIDWMGESPRRPANSAFTAGPDRQLAYVIEQKLAQLQNANDFLQRRLNGELF